MSESNQEKLPLKPYSLKELSGLYNVSKNTFKRWIESINEEMGPRKGYYYTVHQVEIIFKYLGVPDEKRKKK